MWKCYKCGIKRPHTSEFFYRDKTKESGYGNICKECCSIYSREYCKRPEVIIASRERAKKHYHKHKAERMKNASEWAKNNPKKRDIIARRSKLKTKYGLTLEDYDNILKNQKGRCVICGERDDENPKPLYVDHNHRTGKVRGLLCTNCNSGLGMFDDNIEIIKKALNYLKKYKEV